MTANSSSRRHQTNDQYPTRPDKVSMPYFLRFWLARAIFVFCLFWINRRVSQKRD